MVLDSSFLTEMTTNSRALLFSLISLSLIGCKADEVNPDDSAKVVEKNVVADLDSTIRILDRNGVFCEFIPASDSTYSIQWGDSSITYTSDLLLDEYLINPERIRINWHNDRFLSLKAGTGSDTWFEAILSKNDPSLGRIYWNTLAFDRDAGIAVYEYGAKDSLLIAESFYTQEQLVIGQNWTRCGSTFSHYCIDSISISSRELYIEWAAPDIYHSEVKEIIREKIDL